MDRRCAACEGVLSVYERFTFMGAPFVHRYRCACGTRFDVLTPFGEVLCIGLALGLPAVVALLPASKFASAGDRTWILALLVVQAVVFVVLAVRSRRRAKANPLVSRSS